MRNIKQNDSIVRLTFPTSDSEANVGETRSHERIQVGLDRSDLFLRSSTGQLFPLSKTDFEWQVQMPEKEADYQYPHFIHEKLPEWSHGFLDRLEPLLGYFGTDSPQMVCENTCLLALQYPEYHLIDDNDDTSRFGYAQIVIQYDSANDFF